MKTFEKVLEIFQGYLDCDREEEVLKCSQGYLRVTWNGLPASVWMGFSAERRTSYSRCCYPITAATS